MERKISKFEVPVTLKRDKETGEVILDIKDDQKKFVGNEDLPANFTNNEIPNLSNTIANENEKQKGIIRNTLLANEDERETTIVFKYLS